jgi:hypothetical protein
MRTRSAGAVTESALAGSPLVRERVAEALPPARLDVRRQLLRLAEETAAAAVLRSLALVVCHGSSVALPKLPL